MPIMMPIIDGWRLICAGRVSELLTPPPCQANPGRANPILLCTRTNSWIAAAAGWISQPPQAVGLSLRVAERRQYEYKPPARPLKPS